MDALGTFLAPIAYLLDPGKRIFWMYLATAVFAASAVTAYHQKRFDPVAQIKALFDPRYWFHRSSLLDLALVFINTIIRLTLLVPFFGSRLVATILVGSFLQSHVGNSPSFDIPWYVIATLFSVLFFVAEDLSRFSLHLLMHKVGALWSLHKLHHSATNLTPLTLFRVHPLESILYFLRGLIVFGLVSGFFVWLFGSKLTALHILGVDLFGFVFAAAASNLRHSPIWLSFGKLEALFISPAQHQIHHSKDHDHPNYGTCLAIWDQLLKTSVTTTMQEPAQPLQFGLQNSDQRPLDYLPDRRTPGIKV